MADDFTDLHFETYDEESEIFGCNRCSLMMSIIDDRLSSFFSELTNKIKQVEVRLEGLDVLASNVEEMKEFLKAALDRLETTDLKVKLESAEQAQKMIDTKCIRKNSDTSVFFQKDFHPTERQKMRDLQIELSLRRQKGEKHLIIKDGKIVTTTRPFLWGTAVTITLGGPNPPTLKY